MKKILLSPPDMTGDELDYIKDAIEKNWVAPSGFHIDEFEREIGKYVGASNTVAVSSGTAGLHLALLAIGIKPGDKVYCPTFTFAASVNPILYEKGIPVFIDAEKDTWNISPIALRNAFLVAEKKDELPIAVIVTHIYGQNAQMKEIKEICDYYHVPIIEDAAESLGSIYDSKYSGTIGDFGVYSFNGNKIITTSGGGMVVCNDKAKADYIKYIATQAKSNKPYYFHEKIGYNYRLSNLLAGVGRAQLKSLSKKVEKRRDIYKNYCKAFKENEYIELMPEDSAKSYSNRWLSALLLPEGTPSLLLKHLERFQIESRRLWKPMHQQPIFCDFQIYSENQGKYYADELFERGICLPSGSNLTDEEQMFIIEKVNSFFNYH